MSNQRIATTNERLLQLSGHVGAALKPLALGWSMNGRRTVRSELDRCTVWRIVYQSACKHPSKKMHTTILSWNVFDVNGQHLIRCHKSAPPPPPFHFSWDFRDSSVTSPRENWHPSKRVNGESIWNAFVPRVFSLSWKASVGKRFKDSHKQLLLALSCNCIAEVQLVYCSLFFSLSFCVVIIYYIR